MSIVCMWPGHEGKFEQLFFFNTESPYETDFHETSCGSGLSGMLEREDNSGALEGDLLMDDPGGLTGGRGGVAFADWSSPPANISLYNINKI